MVGVALHQLLPPFPGFLASNFTVIFRERRPHRSTIKVIEACAPATTDPVVFYYVCRERQIQFSVNFR